MDLTEDAVRNIREVAARVLKPKVKEAAPEKAPNTVNRVEGTGNVIGNGNVVYIVGGAANDVPRSEHHKKWRNRRIARILAICKEMDRQRQLEQLLAARYGAAILIELADAHLNEVFCLVSTWV
jgi:hypothetical protein